MLCDAMLCFTMLLYAVLCYAMLRYARHGFLKRKQNKQTERNRCPGWPHTPNLRLQQQQEQNQEQQQTKYNKQTQHTIKARWRVGPKATGYI